MPRGKPTKVNVKKLYEMNKAGKSAKQIAEEMGDGMTRSMVLGHIHRYKKKHGITTDKRVPPPKPVNKDPRPPKPKPELKKVDVEPLHKKIEDLSHRDCRYPYGDGPFTFCGHPAEPWSSYCASHREVCVRKTVKMEDAA